MTLFHGDNERHPVRTRAIALLWGFAEATLFFVIPDVWISFVALRSTRAGLAATAWSIAGALCGGTLVYLVAQRHQPMVLATFDRLPAIDPPLIARVAHELDTLGPWSVLIGPFTGAPYKLYAAQAATAEIGLWPFLAISVPARGIRFTLIALLSGLAARWATPRIGAARVRWAWLLVWSIGYAIYWL